MCFAAAPHPQHPAPVAGKDACRRGAAPPGQPPAAVTMATAPPPSPIPSSSLLPRRQPRLSISRVATVTSLPLPFGGGRRSCHGNGLLSVAVATASVLLPCCHGNAILPTPSCPPPPPPGALGHSSTLPWEGQKGPATRPGPGPRVRPGSVLGRGQAAAVSPGHNAVRPGPRPGAVQGPGAVLPVLPRASPAPSRPRPARRFPWQPPGRAGSWRRRCAWAGSRRRGRSW